MAIRIPQNKIIKSKYTVGKEYMFETTYREYQGYYYELNGKLFAGKEFNSNAPILVQIKPSNLNKLLTNARTYAYGRASGMNINSNKPSPFFYRYESDIRYFIYEINKNLIKEINKDTFDAFQTNSLYVTVKLSFTSGFNEQELKEAETKIPGITTFVNTSYTNPSVEEDGTIG
jgi:hypothetical protein